MSIFQNVDWVTSLTMVVCLAVIFAIVNGAPQIVSSKKRGETTVGGCAATKNVVRGKTT